MAKVLLVVLGLSLIIERITEKLLLVFPTHNNRLYAWIISTILAMSISFSFRLGIIGELGLTSSLHIAKWVDYFITGLLLASGSEPVHSIVDALAIKRDELKKRVKGV